MNNRGFAITTLLYSLFILFLLVFLSLMSSLRTENSRLITTITTINEENAKKNTCSLSQNLSVASYEIPLTSKYYLTVNYLDNTSCENAYLYLPQKSLLSLQNHTLYISQNNFSQKTSIPNCSNSNIKSIDLIKYDC